MIYKPLQRSDCFISFQEKTLEALIMPRRRNSSRKLQALFDSNDFDFRDAIRDLKQKSHFLNKLISLKLQTNKEFRDLMSEAIDNLCRHIHQSDDCRNYSPNRLIKGGSLGKGTALRSTSDLDCVLVLNDFEDAEDLETRIDEIRNKLYSCLFRNPTSYLQSWYIQFERSTRFSIQFTMTKRSSPGEAVEVDLLPTFNIPNSDALTGVYREMGRKNPTTRGYYSAALTEFQRDFVKKYPARIKDLIRLVKYWCKRFVKQEDIAPPSSYLLELITIYAWEKVGKPTTINMAIAFKAVMQELKNYRDLDAIWHLYYQENQEMNEHRLPRVLDPANPYNNVCDRVDWEDVARIASETMLKPLFQDIEITSHWCRGPPPMPSRRRRLRHISAPCYITDDEFKDYKF